MPLYEYCNFKGECFDEIYLSWKDAPQSIVRDTLIYRRQFPAPTVKFKGPFSGGTPRKNILQGAYEKDSGQKVMEPGMDKDVKRYKKERKEKQDKERRKFIEKELANY
jgi:hypothetical protein